jgi:benzoate-CoA ligase family protein
MVPFNACEYLLDRRVEAGDGSRVAIRCRGESITYDELLERVCRVGSGLRALGVRPEERVALALLDGPEFAAAFLGAMRIGAVPLSLNPLLPGRDLGLIVADGRARVAIVSAERAETAVPGLVAGAPELTDVVLTGNATVSVEGVCLHRWNDLAVRTGDAKPYPTWEDSPGFWLCTSGTTGRPKLAMHRHDVLRRTAEGYAREVLAITPDDRLYSVAPMFHAYGLGNSLSFPLSVGATAILEPTRPPAPALVESVVTSERPTLFFSVPTSYGALLASDLSADTFRSVRQAVSAGEALPEEFCTRFHERFGVEILDGIGTTELGHIVISNRRGKARPGTSGTVVGGYEVQLLDDEGNVLPLGSVGHLYVRGESAANGYWCQAETTRRTFRGEWVRTGDMYATSQDGFLSYLGRSDDMIKVGGEWVSPAEVEAALLEHTSIVEAAVIGETTPEGLLQPVAYVVAAPGQSVDAELLIAHCRARLAGYKRPRRIVSVPDLPKTATGKIQRVELRKGAVQPASAH